MVNVASKMQMVVIPDDLKLASDRRAPSLLDRFVCARSSCGRTETAAAATMVAAEALSKLRARRPHRRSVSQFLLASLFCVGFLGIGSWVDVFSRDGI